MVFFKKIQKKIFIKITLRFFIGRGSDGSDQKILGPKRPKRNLIKFCKYSFIMKISENITKSFISKKINIFNKNFSYSQIF